jgi:serine/threonine protein kinase
VVLPSQTLLKLLEERYTKLKRVVDPSLYRQPDKDSAEDANAKLDKFYELAKSRIRQYIYGIPGRTQARPAHATKSFNVGPNRYYLGTKLNEGSHSNTFEAFMERDGTHVGDILLKVAKDPSHNPFLKREARNLDVLHELMVPQWKHLPFIMDRFESGGRMGIAFRRVSGYSLRQVHEHRTHRTGVDQKHIVWMLDRLFSCLGYVHSQGLVHGDLNPDHILIQPPSHNAIICGWAAAAHKPAITRESLTLSDHVFAAPEARSNGQIGPWSDIYSVGKLMIWLIGGDPAQNTIPSGVAGPISRFLLSMVVEDHERRPADAWKLFNEQCAIKDSLWPRQFVHFDMS